jgi:nucleoside-diphosphate-sugar epimerase
MNLLIFGLGYTALGLAENLQGEGWSISGTVTSLEKRDSLSERGIKAFLFHDDDQEDELCQAVENATYILSSVPPLRDGSDPVLENYAVNIQKNKNLQWIGYLSSTGVYGDHQGAWVDETSVTSPQSVRAQARLKAEQKWQKSLPQQPLNIFRLSGIYGPYKNVIHDLQVNEIERVLVPDHVFSRIHVDDIVHVLKRSMRDPNIHEIFNVADDLPTPRLDLVDFAYDFLGKEKPPLKTMDQANLSEMTRDFYRDRKKVCNAKIKTQFGINLLYPTYVEGLKACIQEERILNQD